MFEAKRQMPEGMSREYDSEVSARLKKAHDDYIWFVSQPPLREQYGDRFVVVHERQVLGSGESVDEARADAVNRVSGLGRPFPPNRDLLIFVVPIQVWEDEAFVPPANPIPLSRDDFPDLEDL